jgi:hypothetical protein
MYLMLVERPVRQIAHYFYANVQRTLNEAIPDYIIHIFSDVGSHSQSLPTEIFSPVFPSEIFLQIELV